MCSASTVELGYNVTKVLCVVITEQCNVMDNSEELISTTEYIRGPGVA